MLELFLYISLSRHTRIDRGTGRSRGGLGYRIFTLPALCTHTIKLCQELCLNPTNEYAGAN